MIAKEMLLQSIDKSYNDFIAFVNSLSESEFVFAEKNAWSAGQQLEHLVKSVAPLNTYMALPNFAKKLAFGTNKSASKSYEVVVSDYLKVIDLGGKASKAFIPKTVGFSQRENLNSKLKYIVTKLINSLNALEEKNFDILRVPHPLLGKMTLREMLYFTEYHVKHHQASILKNLKK